MDKGDIMGKKNPLKRLEKAGRTAVSQVGAETGRVGADLTKAGESALGAAADPGSWMAYLGNPTAGLAVGSQKARENYETLSQAEQDEARAEAEARLAAAEESRLMEEQRTAQAEQERMTSERARESETQARERAKRIGSGRRGLLYQGKATGVNNTVLGG